MSTQTPEYKNKKGGRPNMPEKEKRNIPVKVYFDTDNYRRLLNKQRRTGISLSTLVYELSVNGYVKEPITKEQTAYIRDLSGMANNLNQLAREAHTYHMAYVENKVRNLADRIDELLIKISEK